jgi:hypothetical protein
MALPIIKALIDWDYDFEKSFQTRDKGYTFVIDTWESPKLALYKFTPFGVKCDHTDIQPPLEMLEDAINSQNESKEKLYRINQELRTWIEANILTE